jgi:4,5-DOPA dioxygenase extradiol
MAAIDPDVTRNHEVLFPMTDSSLPVIFVGHGSPENALGTNEYNQNWKRLGHELPRPKLILSISAHWVIHEGTAVTAMDRPRTIHDFYGFPEELYGVEYGAPGSPTGAELIQNVVRSVPVHADHEWGLDHGTWSVLTHMFPDADIPVVQFSLNYHHPPELHYEIGRQLRELRRRGVLIIGSGNLVHNLMMIRFGEKSYAWAIKFDEFVRNCIRKNDYEALVHYENQDTARLAHPTSEHYLPLLYVLGAAGNDSHQFFNEEIFAGSISMRSVVFGLDPVTL